MFVDGPSIGREGRAPSWTGAAVHVVDDGPLVVRGAIVLLDEEGCEIPLRRRVNALCRCGRSSIQPFCDSTHRIVPFSPRASRGNGDAVPGTGSLTAR
jgi:CDGSH-type Zn-finger protein